MTERELKTQSNAYNSKTAQGMGLLEIWNTGQNIGRIRMGFAEGRFKDLSDEPKKELKPVIITGSGPSLDDKVEKLKDWKGDIVAHFSQAMTLRYYGIIPDYIVCLDAMCNWEELSGVDWAGTKTKLIAHPGIYHSIIANWPNEILFYIQNLGKPDDFTQGIQRRIFNEPVSIMTNMIEVTEKMYGQVGGTLDELLATQIRWAPLIKTSLMSFAHTPAAQLMAAKFLQYGPMFLCGLDFCYKDNKARFSNFSIADGVWTKNENYLPPDKTEFVITKSGHPTDPIHLYYKRNFLSAARMCEAKLFTTDNGALTEVPYVDIDKVIECEGKGIKDIPPEVRFKNYERLMAEANIFTIKQSDGMRFVEVKDPYNDIHGYCFMKNSMYGCDSCGTQVEMRDIADHTKEKCGYCNDGKLYRVSSIDTEETLKRVKSLVEYVKESHASI